MDCLAEAIRSRRPCLDAQRAILLAAFAGAAFAQGAPHGRPTAIATTTRTAVAKASGRGNGSGCATNAEAAVAFFIRAGLANCVENFCI